MKLAWVRYGDEIRSFSVVQKKLVLSAIADYWNLQRPTLCIGDHVLALDENSSGKSLLEIEDIRQLASSSGFGDGLSKESALTISGKSKGREGAPRRYISSGAQKKRRMCLQGRLVRAVTADLYAPDKIHGYIDRVLASPDERKPQTVEQEVRPFVCTVHIAGDKNEITAKNCVGMASLLRPDGSCMTAYECVKDRVKCFVSFPHLQRSGTVSYECKVTPQGTWALLEPSEPKSFHGCLAVCGIPGFSARVFTFSLENGEIRVAEGVVVAAPTISHNALLPRSKINTLGAPLLVSNGNMGGLVVGWRDLKLKRPRRGIRNHCHEFVSLQEFEPVKDGIAECYRPLFTAALESRQLVFGSLEMDKFETPVDEWYRTHPLEGFAIEGEEV